MPEALDIAAPSSIEEFEARLRDPKVRLPKRLRQCADYVLEQRDRVALATVADLSAGAGVQPSAFVRFCQVMGFSGFSELQRLYRQNFDFARPDYSTRLQQLEESESSMVARFVDAGRQSVESLLDTLDTQVFAAAVKTLAGSNTIHIVGMRRAFPVATHLSYSMDKMGIPTLLHDGIGGGVKESLLRAGDAMIAISFAPYSDETLDAAKLARDNGMAVVGISDVAARGMSHLSNHLLSVRETQVGEFRGLSAAMTLSIALSVEVGQAISTK